MLILNFLISRTAINKGLWFSFPISDNSLWQPEPTKAPWFFPCALVGILGLNEASLSSKSRCIFQEPKSPVQDMVTFNLTTT